MVRIHVGEPYILWWKCLIPIRLTAALSPSLCNTNIPKTSDFSGSLRFGTLLLDLRVKPRGLSSDPRVFGIKLSVFSVASCIVDQHIDWTEADFDGVEGRGDGIGIADVARHREGPTAS